LDAVKVDVVRGVEVFDRIRRPDVPIEISFTQVMIFDNPRNGFGPESYTFPGSSLGVDVRVEVVVGRSDESGRWVKLVRRNTANSRFPRYRPLWLFFENVRISIIRIRSQTGYTHGPMSVMQPSSRTILPVVNVE
jgi:hypothetical protein